MKKSDSVNDDAFSNQDIFIRKCEKNIWANNPFIRVSESQKRNENPIDQTVINVNEVRKKILTTADNQKSAQKFEIKICSNYIDPSSLNLSFSNNIWLISPSLDKFLLVNNDEDKVKNILTID